MKQDQHVFWEQAGEKGYGQAMFSDSLIESHIRSVIWGALIKTADNLQIGPEARILELGCGDGDFVESVLYRKYKFVECFDYSETAIDKARARFAGKSDPPSFYVKDVVSMEFEPDEHWDASFMVGFLHHVKDKGPQVINKLSGHVSKVVVAEPNGNNIIRKLLELLPSYRQAGEQSFRLKELITMFKEAGYELVHHDIVLLTPPFLPSKLLPLFERLERLFAKSGFLKKAMSTNILGFRMASAGRK